MAPGQGATARDELCLGRCRSQYASGDACTRALDCQPNLIEPAEHATRQAAVAGTRSEVHELHAVGATKSSQQPAWLRFTR